MNGTPPVSGAARPDRASADVGVRDPLDAVTELDRLAEDRSFGVFRGTTADGLLRVNSHFLAITGLSAGAARGWDWLSAVHSEDRDRLRRALDAACQTGAGSSFPIRVQVRLGVIESLRVTVMASAVTDESWIFVGGIEAESARAPTRSPSTPEAIGASTGPDGADDAEDDPFRVLVETLPVAVAYAAPDGVIEFANDEWRSRTGVGVDGNIFAALTIAADDLDDEFSVAWLTDVAWSGVRRVGSSDISVAIAPVPAASGGGQVVTLSGAQPPSVMALAQQIAVFGALADVSVDDIAITSADGTFLHLNPPAREKLGIGLDADLSGYNATDLLHWVDHTDEVLADTAVAHLSDGGMVRRRGELTFGDGDPRPTDLLLYALRGPDGEHAATVCIGRDQTDMHEARLQVAASERWYRALVQNSADVLSVMNESRRVTFVSPRCRELLGFEPEQLMGENPLIIVHDDDRAAIDDAMARARENTGPIVVRYRVTDLEGTLHNLETHIENMLDDPVINGLVLNTRDITESEARDRARERSEAALQTVVSSAPVAIFAVDLEGHIQLWNPACEQLFGWSHAEVIGKFPPFIAAEQREVAAAMRERQRAGASVTGPAKFTRRDGEPIVLSLSSAPIVLGDERAPSVLMVAVDMTATTRSTEELQHRAYVDQRIAALARSLVGAGPETIEKRTAQALAEVAADYGASAAALFVRSVVQSRSEWWANDTNHETHAFSLDLGVDSTLNPDGAPEAGAFVVPAQDGVALRQGGWVVAGAGGAVGILALKWDTLNDVTVDDLQPLEIVATALLATVERVDAELAVRASEHRYRALAEHATDLVVVVGSEMQLQYLSPSASRFLGMDEGSGFDPANSVIHPDDLEAVVARMAEIARQANGSRSEPVVARFRRADGVYRWCELAVTNLLAEPVIEGIVINARDVTERRVAEESLRESERSFRGLVQNLAEAVVILGADGSVKYSTPSAARMMGFSDGFGDGMLALDFVVEADRERTAEIVGRAFSEPGIHGPISLRVHAADGEIRVVEALGHNRLDDPDVEGVVVTARDITARVRAEEAARYSDARLSALVENLSDVVTIVGPDARLMYSSPAAQQLFGFVEGDESWTDPMARIHPDDLAEVTEKMSEHLAGLHQEPVRFRLRAADESWHAVEAIARNMMDDPAVGGVVVTTRDVSERTRAESLVADQASILTLIARGAQLQETLGSICSVLERHVGNAVFGVLLVDPERQVLRLGAGPRIPMELANACDDLAIDATSGAFGSAVLGSSAVVGDDDADWRTEHLRTVAEHVGVAGIWSTPIFDSLGQRVIGIVAGFFDSASEPDAHERTVVDMFAQTGAIAIERQVSEDLLAHRANHDSLTGLPNRVLFLEFLALALVRSNRDRSTVAVLFLDLDRFKYINDGLGHEAGDELLREIANRLRDAMRPSDVIARFGGDEFTVLCDGLDPSRAEEQAREISRRLLDVIELPVTIEDEDRRLSASLGIALVSEDSTAESLLRDADAAMYQAKQNGKARWEIFDDHMRSTMNDRLDLERQLERAIERNEFRLFLQPIVDLTNGRCVGAEALLRWQNPEVGLVSPDAFIGLAEESGLIIPIGEWALAEACRTVARWEQVGLLEPDFTMAVNLSARQVAQSELADKVRAVIERNGSTASRICLEITESVLMEESSVEVMAALKDLGVRLSIDDFGTGYSSLGYLKRFPVDSVKVDRSFVDGLGTDAEDSAIVAAVVSLGHALGLSVVAEGVETSGQLQALLALGCDRAQGYWFSGPREPNEFAGLLHAQPWIEGRSSWTSSHS